MYNVSARGIHTPNVVVGMALFTGGLLQFLAGMWEFPRGNAFGATGKFIVLKGKKRNRTTMGVLPPPLLNTASSFFPEKNTKELAPSIPF